MKKDERLSVGDRIAIARDTYQLSQAQLGANLGVTRAAISQYEKDKITPRPRVIEKLAELFNVDPQWFEAGRGRAPSALNAPVCIPEINPAGLTAGIADLRDLNVGRELQLPAATLGPVMGHRQLVAILAPNDAAPIQSGDTVVIDTRRRDGDGVFLVVVAGRPQLQCGCDGDVVGRAIAYLHSL